MMFYVFQERMKQLDGQKTKAGQLPYIVVLPASPLECLREYPLNAHAFFSKDALPVACQIDLDLVRCVESKLNGKLRGPKAASNATPDVGSAGLMTGIRS
jgi:hypothetical protein